MQQWRLRCFKGYCDDSMKHVMYIVNQRMLASLGAVGIWLTSNIFK